MQCDGSLNAQLGLVFEDSDAALCSAKQGDPGETMTPMPASFQGCQPSLYVTIVVNAI